jgi:hypothetical protein
VDSNRDGSPVIIDTHRDPPIRAERDNGSLALVRLHERAEECQAITSLGDVAQRAQQTRWTMTGLQREEAQIIADGAQVPPAYPSPGSHFLHRALRHLASANPSVTDWQPDGKAKRGVTHSFLLLLGEIACLR